MGQLMHITILDYGVGNLKSVLKAFQFLGYSAAFANTPEAIENAEFLVFPGQGAISQAMQSLTDKKLVAPLKRYIEQDRPFLGICLGFQLLFDYSEEHGGHAGLGVIPGTVKRFVSPTLKVPHMGWNAIEIPASAKDLSAFDRSQVYYVHSYYVETAPEDMVFAKTTYGVPFIGGIRKSKLWAVQFHPEKSGAVGLSLLEHILRSVHNG